MPFSNPERRREYQRERSRRRRAERRAGIDGPPEVIPTTPNIEPTELRTAADALAVLREQVNAVRTDPAAGVQTRARTVAYLMSIALRAIEVADLTARIAALESRYAP